MMNKCLIFGWKSGGGSDFSVYTINSDKQDTMAGCGVKRLRMKPLTFWVQIPSILVRHQVRY